MMRHQVIRRSGLEYLRTRVPKARLKKSFATAAVSSGIEATWDAAKPFSEIPSFRILPLIGTAWTYLPFVGYYKPERQVEAVKDKRERFGDIVREKFGPMNMVMTYRAEDMEAISRQEGKYPSRGTVECLEAYRNSRRDIYKNNGLSLLEGPEWLELRQKIQKHLLKPQAAEAYLGPTQQVARDFVQRMHDIRDHSKEVPDFLNELYKFALESIAYVGLDARLGCLDSKASPESDGMKMIESVKTQFDCMYEMEAFSGNLPFWKMFPTPIWKKFVNACDVFYDISKGYINNAMNELKVNDGKVEGDLTVLQALLVKEEMDVSDVVVFLNDMIVAGIETTSNTVGLLLYNLARNPEKQELLHKEITRLLPGKGDRVTNTNYQQDLKYLRACLKESMRISPSIGGILRIMPKDSVLNGYQIPAGTPVVIVYLDMFKDERYYTEPDKFLPERWLDREDKFNPFSFLPFGFGTRSCVGRRIAELEMTLLTVEIIRNFKIEYHHEDIGFISKFLLVPDRPLRLKFIER